MAMACLSSDKPLAMKTHHLLSCLLLAFLSACQTEGNSEADPYTYFVTRLGNDTLAIERFQRQADQVTAHVVLRSPSTKLMSYRLDLDDAGGIKSMERIDPADTYFEWIGATLAQKVNVSGDSLINEVMTRNGDMRRFAMVNETGSLPFIDMVHWPFELAFNQASKVANDSIDQKLLTGRRLSNFIIHKVSADSMTLRHPSRGVMGVTVNEQGELLKLDAALTTRKLVVTRVEALDFEGIANAFLERDKNGSPFGSLSGAITDSFSFKGAEFKVSYGSPSKRGRKIFGGIVSWGERWRTGANRATHFSTSRNLKIGDLSVPVGEYTLFTIPEPDGGTLIINKQTGQNGRSYKQEMDLGRVPMTISEQAEVTEAFTIKVVESATGGTLQLLWDQTVFSVDFTID